MKYFHKHYIKTTFLLFIAFFGFMLVGCIDDSNLPPVKVVETLSIYTVNDFHGALEETTSGGGAARMAEYILSKKTSNPDETVILSAGDMFQGTGISNYRHGLDVIEVMNMIGFDAMTIGNHEFDWNLSTILAYNDENLTNGEANFPFLGANINQKSQNALPDHVKPYRIIERGGLKIAVIGYIGYGEEADIATPMVADYEFLQPVKIVGDIVADLRKNQNVDVVIACGHDASSSTNTDLANLAGDSRIDAIVNGHLHINNAKTYRRSDGYNIPCVQAGSSGGYVGVIHLTINPETKQVTNSSVKTEKMAAAKPKNAEVAAYVDKIVAETAPIFNRVIGVAGTEIGRYAAADWAVDALKTYAKTDVGFINLGGIRSDAFPISANQPVTVNNMFRIMPFDNTVKTVTLSGKQVKQLILYGDFVSSSNITKLGSNIYINDELIDENKTYSVVAIDYIFDKPENPFLSGEDIVATGVLFRDVLIQAVEQLTANGEKWYA